jgi:hypothetical protein
MRSKEGTTLVQKISRIDRDGYEHGQYITTIPAALAEGIGMERGEVVQWVLIDRYTLKLIRADAEKDDKVMKKIEAKEKKRQADVAGGKNWLETPRDEE